MPIECANCDNPMKSAEASAFMNQYPGKITITKKAEKSDSLPVHVHSTCAKKLPREIAIQNNSVGKGPLGIVK